MEPEDYLDAAAGIEVECFLEFGHVSIRQRQVLLCSLYFVCVQ